MVQTLELKEARIGELDERLAREKEQRQGLEGQLTQLQAALEGLREQQAQGQAQFDQRLAEAEAKAEARVQEERRQAEKRESLAYERLEGLRIRLYEQVEDERAAMKQTQKRLEEELVSERKVKSQLENTWRERLAEAEREGGRLAATVQVQGERLAQMSRELEEERTAGRENQARLLAVTEQIGTLRASHHALLDRLLPRLASRLSGEGARLAKLDEAALYAWLKNLAGDLLPEASS
jgi:chromosome segregation ATPase